MNNLSVMGSWNLNRKKSDLEDLLHPISNSVIPENPECKLMKLF